MDIDRVEGGGYREGGLSGWLFKHLRRFAWRVISPWIQGLADEVERKIASDCVSPAEFADARREQALLLRWRDELAPRFETLASEQASLAARVETLSSALENLERENAAAHASLAGRVSGAAKDQLAVAHRLASLEELVEKCEARAFGEPPSPP